MGTVHYSAPADLPADEAFAFMSYAPNLKGILPDASDEASIRLDEATRQLSWRDGDEHGEMRVLERGTNASEIEISLETGRGDLDRVQEEVAQSVAALAHKASSDADESAAGPDGAWT